MSSTLKAMELSEISQRVAFLDEERRKDKALIATLMERLETQTGKLDAQARQIQELEGLLANLRAELTRFTQIEQALAQLRTELTLLIEANEEKREKAVRELNRLRQVEQETITRQLTELRQELKLLPRHDEEIQSIHTELGRVNAAIMGLQHQTAEMDKRIESRLQTLAYLEEQRRQDTRRLNELEAETATLTKKIGDLVNKEALLEEGLHIKQKELDRAAELLEEQAQVIENQRVTEFRWERQMAEWAKLVEELKAESANLTSQTARVHEQSERVQRAIADLETFKERIERRQDEMAEIQRIASDRQKRQLEEWQAEQTKQWERFKLENDERWRENARFNEKRFAHMQAMETFMLGLVPQIKALWEVQEAWTQSHMATAREWAAKWGEFAKQRPPMPEMSVTLEQKAEAMPKIRPLPSAQEDEKGA